MTHTDSDSLHAVTSAARHWLDQAATLHNQGKVSPAASASRIGHGYATLAGAYAAAGTGDRRRSVELLAVQGPDSEIPMPTHLPTREEAFPARLRPLDTAAEVLGAQARTAPVTS